MDGDEGVRRVWTIMGQDQVGKIALIIKYDTDKNKTLTSNEQNPGECVQEEQGYEEMRRG